MPNILEIIFQRTAPDDCSRISDFIFQYLCDDKHMKPCVSARFQILSVLHLLVIFELKGNVSFQDSRNFLGKKNVKVNRE